MVVATVVVGGAVEVAGALVVTGVVEVTGILVVVVTVPPPDPPISAFFTETSYLLLASAQLVPEVRIGCGRTRTMGL